MSPSGVSVAVPVCRQQQPAPEAPPSRPAPPVQLRAKAPASSRQPTSPPFHPLLFFHQQTSSVHHLRLPEPSTHSLTQPLSHLSLLCFSTTNLLRSLFFPSSTSPKEACSSQNLSPLPLLTRRSPFNTAVVVVHLPLYSFPPTSWTNKSATIPLTKSL